MPLKYAAILGNLGNTKDRFCGGYKDSIDTFEMLRQPVGILSVSGIELVGTWYILPDNVVKMRQGLGEHGLAGV